jgi:hypothetical protein
MKLERPRGLGRPTKKERRDLDDYVFLLEDDDSEEFTVQEPDSGL